jgi:hypothetical protein
MVRQLAFRLEVPEVGAKYWWCDPAPYYNDLDKTIVRLFVVTNVDYQAQTIEGHFWFRGEYHKPGAPKKFTFDEFNELLSSTDWRYKISMKELNATKPPLPPPPIPSAPKYLKKSINQAS